jgi:integrase
MTSKAGESPPGPRVSSTLNIKSVARCFPASICDGAAGATPASRAVTFKLRHYPRSVSAHYLRHAHVSHALDRGAPAHLAQATVGHSDLRTTSRYAHARPNESSATYLRG